MILNSFKILCSSTSSLPRSLAIECSPSAEVKNALLLPSLLTVTVDFVEKEEYTAFARAEYLKGVDAYLKVCNGYPVVRVGTGVGWIDYDYLDKVGTDSPPSLAVLREKVRDSVDEMVMYNMRRMENAKGLVPVAVSSRRFLGYIRLGIVLIKVNALEEALNCFHEHLQESGHRATDRSDLMAQRYIVLIHSLLSPRMRRRKHGAYFRERVAEMCDYLQHLESGPEKDHTYGTLIELVKNTGVDVELPFPASGYPSSFLLDFSRASSGAFKPLHIERAIESLSAEDSCRCRGTERIKEILEREMLESVRSRGVRERLQPSKGAQARPQLVPVAIEQKKYGIRGEDLGSVELQVEGNVRRRAEGRNSTGLFMVERDGDKDKHRTGAGADVGAEVFTDGSLTLTFLYGREGSKFKDLEVLYLETSRVASLTRATERSLRTASANAPFFINKAASDPISIFISRSTRIVKATLRAGLLTFSVPLDIEVTVVPTPSVSWKKKYSVETTEVINGVDREKETLRERVESRTSSAKNSKYSYRRIDDHYMVDQTVNFYFKEVPLLLVRTFFVKVVRVLEVEECGGAEKKKEGESGSRRVRIKSIFKPLLIKAKGRVYSLEKGEVIDVDVGEGKDEIKWMLREKNKRGVITSLDLPSATRQ